MILLHAAPDGTRRAGRLWAACGSIVPILAVVITMTAWAKGGAAGPPRPGHHDAERRSAQVQIYPTAARLPSNLLRLYLVFDRPMSTGEARAHLRLLDNAGRTVERAFLQLEEELWDASGRRLTVLFDPGRIKRGLRANLESGPPLLEGRRYTLVIDAGWRDAGGRPLAASVSKVFETIAPDRAAPVADQWTIETPAAGTETPLVLRFPEVLDRALLSSAIVVVDAGGETVHGDIDVLRGEQTWTFTPACAWRQGLYSLRVSSELEDVAGNSLRRVFDAEMQSDSSTTDRVPAVLTRPFHVTPK
jgi:hypothetical protein